VPIADHASPIPHRSRAYERWRWQIFAITWLSYAGFTLTRNGFAVTKLALGEGTAVGLTRPQMAMIDVAFLIAYAVGQLVWGVAGDRFGARKVVLSGMFLSVIACLAMGASSSAAAFGTFFFIQGFCQSSGWAPLLKNVGAFFSQGERGRVIGFWCTNYAAGGLVATIFAGYLGQQFGWRFAFYVPAVTLLGVWALFYLFQRDRPEDVGLPPIEVYHQEAAPVIREGDSPEEEPEGAWRTILRVATSPIVMLLSLVYFLIKPVRYAMLFWGPRYISDRLGTGMGASSFLSSLFELAGPFSVLASGWVSDRFFATRRLPVSIICLVLLSMSLLVVDRLPHTPWVLGVCLFLLGLLIYAPDALIAGVAPVDFGTSKGASTASGIINGSGSIGAIAGVTLTGALGENLGWQRVFTFLACGVFLAALLLLPKWSALPAKAGRQRTADDPYNTDKATGKHR
jgi:OPA family glycerol-3-phosphate transporter-like MFS transporter